MNVTRIGVHESTELVFPSEVLRNDLAEIDGCESTVVGSDVGDLAACDAVVTLAYADAFLDAGVDWIHSVQAGVDRFPFEEFEARGVVLTNSTGIHGESVGETTAGYMLSFARRLHVYAEQQSEHVWRHPPWDEPFTLDGETVCVVGLGTLGRGIASRAAGLNMRVTGVKRTVEDVPDVETVYPASALHEAVAEARFVALACPLNEATHHLFDAAAFEAMRGNAYLLNVARGAVVDEEALVEALDAGEIAGAGLDVFETEPLPEDSPLWDMDEVIVTPHRAGSDREYWRGVAAIVRENVDRIREGGEMTNRVV